MECSSCGRSNRAHARFCSGCGAPLTLSCASCGQELLPDGRFCDGCGAAVGASVPSPTTAPSAAARKTVTVLFCDLVGSTAFGEQVDAESSREVMARYRRMVQSAIEANGGVVAKFIGDGVMALWGADEVREDDAEQAVRAGIALQEAFAAIESHVRDRYGATVSLRVGVNTGEVVIDAADDDVVGDALNTAARLEGAATPGRVLVGASTHRATRHAIDYADEVDIQAKGKDAPVAAYEVVGGLSVDERLTPFVGRTEELGRLRRVLESSILDRRAQMVAVIGSPGVGKTRLAQELRSGVDGGVIAHELRCEPSGDATFAPVADLLRAVAGLTDSQTDDQIRSSIRSVVAELADADRVTDLLAGFVGAVPMRSTEEMFFGVRRLLEVLGASDPVVLVVDDIQWAQTLFLDLLEHLAEWVTDVPLLIVALARPEIREVRSSFAEEGRGIATVVSLEGLDESTTRELAARLLDADDLPADVLERIPGSTEGNPLFVREVVRMLVDDGVLVSRDGRWELAIDLDGVEVPPTVTALLASRVDRLDADERQVLELASVVGSEFSIGVLVDVQQTPRSVLAPVLERMRRKELVEPSGAYLGDDPLYRFHHVLIREAVYRRLLKGNRAEMHQAVGEWTEAAAERLVGDFDVTIGNHFEQARAYRLALDLDDDETLALARRAATAFGAAANRALDHEDLDAAGSLASRALSVLDDDADGVADLLVVACEALLSVGRVADAQTLIDRLGAVARGDERLTAWHACFAAELVVLSDPGGVGEAERQAAAAAEKLGALDDTRGVAKAHFVRAAALVRLGQVGACEAELDRALSAARLSDDGRRVTSVLGAAPMAALWGPSPVPRAGGRCLDVIRLLRITTASPAVEATSVRCQGLLEALRGRFDTARSMLDQARETVVELGLGHAVSQVDLYRGIAELLAGDPAAAEAHLREAYRGLGSLGIGADAGQAAAYLARSLLAQGRLDEAEDLVLESDALAGQNPQTAIIGRSVHAEVLAARGDFGEALLVADEAVTLAGAGDILFDHANAVAAQARVYALAGDTDSAAEAAVEATALYERKGATVEVGLAIAVPSDDAVAPARADGVNDDLDAGDADLEPVVAERSRTSAEVLADRAYALLSVGDMDASMALTAPEIRFVDRRAVVGAESAVVGFRQMSQKIANPELELTVDVVDRLGDDVIAYRGRMATASGRAAWEWMAIWHVVDGLAVEIVLVEPEDREGLRREMERLAASSRVEPSAAVEVLEQMFAAIDRDDVETAVGLWHSDVVVDDRLFVLGAESAEEGMVARARQLAADVSVSCRSELLDHRGDDLCLYRVVVAARSGRAEWEYLSINRVVAGHIVHVVLLDTADEVEARAELNRLAGGEAASGTGDPGWDVLLECFRALVEADAEGALASMHPGVRMDDRRLLGPLSSGVGTADLIRPVAHPSLSHDVELIDSRNGVYLYRRTLVRDDGHEWAWLGVARVDQDLVTDMIFLEIDDLDAARATMDELAGSVSAPAPARSNRVADVASEVFTHLGRGDLDGAFASIADDYTMTDDRLIPAFDADVSSSTDSMAFIAGLAPFEFEYDVVAARGDRHALLRIDFSGQRDYSFSVLVVDVIDHDGKLSHSATFEVDQIDEATEELNRLWCAGRSPVDTVQVAADAINANDYDAYLATIHPDARVDDRRFIVGSEVTDLGLAEAAKQIFAVETTSALDVIERDGDVVVNSFALTVRDGHIWRWIAVNHIVDGRFVDIVLVDDLDEAHEAFDRMRMAAASGGDDGSGERVVYASRRVRLSRTTDDEGDRFILRTLDGVGAVVHEEDVGEDLERAAELARLWVRESLSDDAQGRASRVNDDFFEAYEHGDIERMASLLTDDFVLRDHRPLGLGTLEGAAYLETVAALLDIEERFSFGEMVEVSADGTLVHGVQLMLVRSGPDWVEVPARYVSAIRDGQVAASEIFDFDNAEGASRRYSDLSTGASDERVIFESQWARLSRITDDHGDRFILRTLDGAGAVVREEDVGEDVERAAEIARGWVRQSLPADAQGRAYAVGFDFIEALEHRDFERIDSLLADSFVLRDGRSLGLGTLERAAYLESVAVLEMGQQNTFGDRVDISDDGSVVHGTLLYLARSGDDWVEFARRTISVIRDGQLVSTDVFNFDDVEGASRRFSELVARSSRERGQKSADPSGERVIYDSRWVRLSRLTDDEGDRFIVRTLDGHGDVVRREDVGQNLNRAAEINRSWVRQSLPDDERGRAFRVSADYFEALEHRDIERIEALLADDFVLRDARSLGFGTLEREVYLDSVAAMLDIGEQVAFGDGVAASDDGTVLHGVQLMLVRSGPDWVEVARRYVSVIRDGRLVSSEIFNFDDVEGASRRFAELVAGGVAVRDRGAESTIYPADQFEQAIEDARSFVGGEPGAGGKAPRAPSNRVTEAWRLAMLAFAADDGETFRNLLHPDLSMEFRQRTLRPPDGGIDAVIRSARSFRDVGMASSFEPIVVLGDRHAVVRQTMSTDDASAALAFSVVLAADGDGRVESIVVCDEIDLRLAFAEVIDRYLASDAELDAHHRMFLEDAALYNRLGASHGIEGYYSQDFRTVDHRASSMFAEIDRAQYFELQREIAREHPDLATWQSVEGRTSSALLVRLSRWLVGADEAPSWEFFFVARTVDGIRTRYDAFDLDQEADARRLLAELGADDPD